MAMVKALSQIWVMAASGGLCLLAARSAHAAPPGEWSIAVERLFGLSRVTSEIETPSGDVSTTATSISIFTSFSGLRGYSTPRLAFDYLARSGVTFGGAVGYETISFDGGADTSAWLLAARVGYFARPSAGFGIWPRVGLTHVALDIGDDDDDDETATALTLEVPLVFLLGPGVGLTLTPHADIGIAGGNDQVDRTTTELGLQFGGNVFF